MAAFFAFPLVMTHAYYMHLTNLILVYAIAATGLNLVTGYTGQLSLGHAAFFAVGAYSSALLAKTLGWPFLAALLTAVIIAMVFGAVLGLPSLRLRGPYLALATAGFAEIIWIVINNWEKLTHGSRGIPEIPPASFFGFKLSTEPAWYYFLSFLYLLCTFGCYRLLHSHYGRAFVAMRDNEPAAGVSGINTLTYKVLAFAISAFLSGLAGSLYAHYRAYVSPDSFTFAESVTFLAMIVVGGKGTLPGPLVGATALILIPDLLSFLQDFKMVFHGILLVLTMMFLPGGLISLARIVRKPAPGKLAVEEDVR